jgi:hypothetical protein
MSRPSAEVDEKAATAVDPSTKEAKEAPKEIEGEAASSLTSPEGPQVQPVSLLKLFRYDTLHGTRRRTNLNSIIVARFTTPYELSLDAIGLVAAIAAGAAQVSSYPSTRAGKVPISVDY